MRNTISPKQLANAIGVSESSLKRWADDGRVSVIRTAGGHRRIPITEAIRFVRAQRVRIVDPTVFGVHRDSIDEDSVESTERPALLFETLVRGDGEEVTSYLMALFLRGASAAEIFDDVLAPAMSRVGELWSDRDDGIFLEHRATTHCLQAIHQLHASIEVPSNAIAAVGAAPSGDPYLLPTLAAATCLRDAGIGAVNIGPDTPLKSLAHAITRFNARFAWLSVTSRPPADFDRRCMDFVRQLAADRADSPCQIVIGGSGAQWLTSVPEIENVHIESSMRELVAFARGLVSADATPNTTVSPGKLA